MLPRSLALLTLAFAACGSAAMAQLVPSAIVSDAGTSPAVGDFYLMFYQDAAQTDNTDAIFNYDPSEARLRFVNVSLDEGSDWYLVSEGQIFGWSGISKGDYTRLDYGDSVELSGMEIYLAATTGQGPYNFSEPDWVPNRSVLGWVKFSVEETATGHGLRLVSSAAAYGADGIVVGAPVPEPASAAVFLGLGAVLLAATRRRSRPHPLGC